MSTIPAGVPFVDALASGLLVEAGSDPLALADMLVLLPNRRACRALRDAFWRVSERRALALPAIQPIGDLDPDDYLIDAESELDLPPAIGDLRRRLLLMRLLMRAESLDLSSDQAGRLADDRASLLDELQTERIPFESLHDLVPAMFADHWRQSLQILQIIGEHWPAVLEEEGALDPAERRHRVLTAIAHRWSVSPPKGRVLAAGSTGSIPATRILLKVIASLPKGEVVLPGLDREINDESWDALTPQHPQDGLKQLLAFFAIDRSHVGLWPGVDESSSPSRIRSRVRLWRDVMVPSGVEDCWRDAAEMDPTTTSNVTLATHPDPASEATAIALRLRAALLVEGQHAALVTPDRSLARRVVVELRRFGIEIDDSAGVPLDRTATGSFLLLTARLMLEKVRPVALLSVLKHPLMRAGLEAEVVRKRARALDRLCLRGPAIIGGFKQIIGELNGLRQRVPDDQVELKESFSELRDWLESLAVQAAPFAALLNDPNVPLGALADEHVRFAEALASVDGDAEFLWAKESGEAAAALFREILQTAEDDDRLPPTAYPALLARMMNAVSVRPRRPSHPRLSIYGQLEARLQQTDLTILAGLNEGVWPRPPEPGPWLNPAMREVLGLPALERRIGQAAHDLVQLASGPNVVLSRAEKSLDGSPTVLSRWVVRLNALLAARIDHALEAIEEKPFWRQWVESLDDPGGHPTPEPQPKPKPPVAVRPRTLTVSDVGLWMNNAYGLYAKRILKLKPLDALEGDPEAGDRGTIIHEALERFVRAHPETMPDQPFDELRAFGRESFARFDHRPQVRALWWPRFLESARWVVTQEEASREVVCRILAEVNGELEIDAPAGPFCLTARADRLELRADGEVVVVDYKTGTPPSVKDIVLGLAPQLALEGAIVQRGGFSKIGKPQGDLALVGLQFWRLSGNEDGGKLEQRPVDLAGQAFEGLSALVRHFDLPTTAYPAAYRPPTARHGDYDHLARLGEWPI
ncbi:MAG: double-strand break repair protein AddB [Pseudomonadota bacterium]